MCTSAHLPLQTHLLVWTVRLLRKQSVGPSPTMGMVIQVSKVVSSLNHALIIQFFKGYRLEVKWVLGHAVFGGVVHYGMPRNFSLGCRIDQQV